jgi:chromosome segregation ATPase
VEDLDALVDDIEADLRSGSSSDSSSSDDSDSDDDLAADIGSSLEQITQPTRPEQYSKSLETLTPRGIGELYGSQQKSRLQDLEKQNAALKKQIETLKEQCNIKHERTVDSLTQDLAKANDEREREICNRLESEAEAEAEIRRARMNELMWKTKAEEAMAKEKQLEDELSKLRASTLNASSSAYKCSHCSASNYYGGAQPSTMESLRSLVASLEKDKVCYVRNCPLLVHRLMFTSEFSACYKMP